jgi:transposase-like protein
MNYPLSIVVCDELDAIPLAARFFYPKVRVQICTNHYKENIRRLLNSRSTPIHEHFIKQLEYLFRSKTISAYCRYARKLLKEHGGHPIYRRILLDLNKKHEVLIRYLVEKGVPGTNNLIESFNSHLEARVGGLKGFESFETAELWLNAYVMNRRLTKFTCCTKPFAYLNNRCSLSITAGDDVPKVSLLKRVR